VEGSAVRPSAFSNFPSEAIPDEPSTPNQLSPRNPIFAMADCCIRLANKINAGRMTNSVISQLLTRTAGLSSDRCGARERRVPA
jgi:hypothetical protein